MTVEDCDASMLTVPLLLKTFLYYHVSKLRVNRNYSDITSIIT